MGLVANEASLQKLSGEHIVCFIRKIRSKKPKQICLFFYLSCTTVKLPLTLKIRLSASISDSRGHRCSRCQQPSARLHLRERCLRVLALFGGEVLGSRGVHDAGTETGNHSAHALHLDRLAHPSPQSLLAAAGDALLGHRHLGSISAGQNEVRRQEEAATGWNRLTLDRFQGK